MELIVRAGNAAVVEFSATVRVAVAEPLEIRKRRQDVNRPSVESPKDGRRLPCQFFGVRNVSRSLSVGRIADQTAVLILRSNLVEAAAFESRVPFNARLAGMPARHRKAGFVDVAADDRQFPRATTASRAAVRASFQSFLGIAGQSSAANARPVRGPVAAQQGRFNRDRPRSAERIEERPPAVPITQLNESRPPASP